MADAAGAKEKPEGAETSENIGDTEPGPPEVPTLSPIQSGAEGCSASAERQENVIQAAETPENDSDKGSDKDTDNEPSPAAAAEDSFKRPMIVGPLRKPIANAKVKPQPQAITSTSKAINGKSDAETETKTEPTDNCGHKESDISTTDAKEGSEIPRKGPSLSPAEQLKQTQQPIPYLEPKWGSRAEKDYSLEVIKNGQVINTIKLEKSFYVFGRLPVNDVHLEHPSLSRFHAVLQYCGVPNDQHEVGWYLYDLESTHGTFINKLQMKARIYYRIRVGFVLKFAGSSRLHILQGPDEDQQDESELTITEMKQERERKKQEDELAKKLEDAETKVKEEEDTGCSWGMADDAIDPDAETPFMELLPQNEELYLDDPKKTLKGFFEREGYDLPEYQFEEAGHGKHKCIVEVPVDSPTGQPVYAEAVVTGKRKDAVIACALEACRVLDRYGLLRKKEHEAKKVKLRDWEENDYYGSDEDEFLDRTGEIQKKREMRMKRMGKTTVTAETFESLSTKLNDVVSEVQDIEKKLEEAKKNSTVAEAAVDLDALDAYMSSIKKGAMDTKTRMSLKRRLFELRKEQQRLEKLVNIARPALMPHTASGSQSKLGSRGKIGGLTRKMGGASAVRHVTVPRQETAAQSASTVTSVTDEFESDHEDSEEKQKLQDPQTQKSTGEKAKVSGERQTDVAIKLEMRSDSQNEASQEELLAAAKKAALERLQEVHDRTTESHEEPKQKVDNAPQFVKAPEPKKKRSAEPPKAKPKKPKTMPLSKEYATDDPNYAVWVPPQGQTGDGKTHLNEKFGY